MEGATADTGTAGDASSPRAERIFALHVPPVHLDLLGLSVRFDGTTVAVDAEPGAAKPAGALAAHLIRALDHLDLGPAVDEFVAEAGGTFKSFARLASGRKLVQGVELGRVLAQLAGQRFKSGLRRVAMRRGGPAADAPA